MLIGRNCSAPYKKMAARAKNRKSSNDISSLANGFTGVYEGCSKRIAYFYLETSNFKLVQKYSFHSLEVLPVARNAKFQPMYPLLEGVTVP